LYAHSKVSEVQWWEFRMSGWRSCGGVDSTEGGGNVDEEEIRKFVRKDRLLQDSAICALRDQFPMTVTGKIQKFRIREMRPNNVAWKKVAKLGDA